MQIRDIPANARSALVPQPLRHLLSAQARLLMQTLHSRQRPLALPSREHNSDTSKLKTQAILAISLSVSLPAFIRRHETSMGLPTFSAYCKL